MSRFIFIQAEGFGEICGIKESKSSEWLCGFLLYVLKGNLVMRELKDEKGTMFMVLTREYDCYILFLYCTGVWHNEIKEVNRNESNW